MILVSNQYIGKFYLQNKIAKYLVILANYIILKN